jgi:hypothetical protein
MRYAIVKTSTKKVVNVILLGDAPYKVADGHELVRSETAEIGDTYNNGQFTRGTK